MGKILPDFVKPMLARAGKPFDSSEFLFEIKWDGVRAIAVSDKQGTNLISRNGHPLNGRYPELDQLGDLTDGLILDGEIVTFRNGVPDFELALSQSARETEKGEVATAYMVFDLLYEGYEAVTDEPIQKRRARLQNLIADLDLPNVRFSESIQESGLALFESASASGLEGIVAKKLDSRYLPGTRSPSWIKIKRRQSLYCVVLGYVAEKGRVKSLLIGANDAKGELQYTGKVGSGFSETQRISIFSRLQQLGRESSVIPIPINACWVDPELFCVVSFTERTRNGLLRAAVFEELVG